MALIAGALTLIASQIINQASTLSTNVVEGFNQLIDYLRNGPIPISEAWLDTSEWSSRIQLPSGQPEHHRRVCGRDRHRRRPVPGRVRDRDLLAVLLSATAAASSVSSQLHPARLPRAGGCGGLKGWRSLSSYVRATILVVLVDAIGVLIVALILGVPVAPALAALVFIGALSRWSARSSPVSWRS